MNTRSKVSIAGVIVFIAVVAYSAVLLRANQKVLQSSEEILELQELTEHTNKFSSSLGILQSYFKNYIADQSVANRDSLQFYRETFVREMKVVDSYDFHTPELKSALGTLSRLFELEFSRMQQTIQHLPRHLTEAEVLSIYAQNNNNVNVLWGTIETIKKQQDKLLLSQSTASKNLSILPFRIAIFGSISLLLLFLWCFSFLSKTFKKQLLAEERERASDLERSRHEKLLQAVVDNSPSIIYLKDTAGRYSLVNERFKKLVNLPETAILGKTHQELVAGDYVQYLQADESTVLETGEPLECLEQVRIYRDNRDYFTIKFPLRDGTGEIFGLGGISTDITDRTRYESELKLARKVAEDSKNSQEKFLANMSHEIRTPVNNVIGITNLLESTQLTAEQREYLAIIKQSSSMLIVIVNDILDLSKIRAGMLDIDKEPTDIPALVKQACSNFRLKADRKAIALTCSTDPQIPALLMADPVRLNQILSNLINNAVKFTTFGEVKVSVEALSVQEDVSMLNFKVKDTGIGIHPAKLNMIFNSFTQSDTHIARQYGGTGLGLAIVNELSLLMGGKVSVKSEPAQGSTFEVRMPFSSFNEVNGNHQQSACDLEKGLEGRSILIVEDNLLNQNVARQTLQKAGGLVEVADNGFVALFLLKEKKFDVVLMDMHMADMDGIETTLKIRNELRLATPVIALTAAAMKEDQELCMKAGMNGYVTKPFLASELLTTILRTLSN